MFTMKKKSTLFIVPVMALGAVVLSAGPAFAASNSSYQATLGQLNGSSASGTVMVTVNGDQATITEKISGLPASFMGKPYPHVQHIHVGGEGVCPTPNADKNGDGVVSTTEGEPSYGPIAVTLSTSGDTSPKAGTDLAIAPSGASFTYNRTITLDAATLAGLKDGKASVVVHGLDPATLSKAGQDAKSELVPSLPLAATSPALCGELASSQMALPNGAPDTGSAATSNGPDLGMLAVGGGLVLAAGGVVVARRRIAARNN